MECTIWAIKPMMRRNGIKASLIMNANTAEIRRQISSIIAEIMSNMVVSSLSLLDFLFLFYIWEWVNNESLKTVIINIIVIISGLVELFLIMMISLIIMIMIMFSMVKFLILFLGSKTCLYQFTNTFTCTNSDCWGYKEFPQSIHDIFNPSFKLIFVCLTVSIQYIIINVWLLERDINNKYNWYYSTWFWRDRFINSDTV